MKLNLLGIRSAATSPDGTLARFDLDVQASNEPAVTGSPAAAILELFAKEETVSELIAALLQWGSSGAKPGGQSGLQRGEAIPQSLPVTWSQVLKDDDGSPLLVVRTGRATLALRLSTPDAAQTGAALVRAAAETSPPRTH